MAEAVPTKIRIYCICGQKMRVSEKMFGRPGKCVACRQKIRIPTLTELPDASGEVYLKDHPEFLRKVKPAPVSVMEEEEAEDREDLSLGELPKTGVHVPMDLLEPLQILCSYDHKLHRQFELLDQSKTGKLGRLDKATLMSYRALLRNARANLDEKMRNRLHELTEQLDNTNEQIARALLAIRIGEKDYSDFMRAVTPLRQRRERLERRRQNLLGWLATTDPYLAGGYIDVQLEDVPCEKHEVSFPLEAPRSGPLVDGAMEGLRQALAQREAAEKKLNEWQRMEREGSLTQAALEECRADSEATRKRARAAVAFYRERLEQITQDCESDINAIKAHLEVSRGHLASGVFDQHHYNLQESELLQAQSDHVKARDLAARALQANVAADVPQPVGTFLKRIARPGLLQGIGVDSWLAWAAAALMMLTIVVPISNAQVGGNMVVMRGMVMGLFLIAAALATLASIPRREIRALLITVLWLFACLAGSWYIHQLHLSMGSVGAAMRSDTEWYLRPGVLLLYLSALIMGGAAALGLLPLSHLRGWFIAAFVVVITGVTLIQSDLGGLLRPKPFFEEPTFRLSATDTAHYEVTLSVGNRGWRSFWIGDRLSSQLPFPAMFLLEKQIGPDSWKDMGVPESMQARNGAIWNNLNRDSFPQLTVHPQESFSFRYRLVPGSYRVQLRGLKKSSRFASKSFSLAALEEQPRNTATPVANPPQDALAQDPSAEESDLIAPTPPVFVVQLHGVIDSEDRSPRFPVTVTDAQGLANRYNLALGDALYGDWKALEFSPTQNSLTLSDGKRMLILQPGETLEIPVPETEHEVMPN